MTSTKRARRVNLNSELPEEIDLDRELAVENRKVAAHRPIGLTEASVARILY